MAKYRIKSPDGGTYEINAPDNASESDVLSFAQRNFNQNIPNQQTQQDDTTFLGNALRGLDLSYKKTMEGLAQGGLQAGAGITEKLGFPETAEKLRGGEKFIGTQIEAEAPEREKLLGTAGGFVGSMAGDISQISGISAPLKLAKTAPLIADVIGSGVFGASQTAENPEDRLARGLTDAALSGVAGRVLGGQRFTKSGQQALEAKTAQKAADIAMAEASGIPVGITQATESPLVRMIGTTAEKLSLTNPSQRARDAFNAAITKQVGVDAERLTPEVLDVAKKQLGDVFDASTKYGLPNASLAINDIQSVVSKSWQDLPESVRPSVAKIVGDIKSLVRKDGSISGDGLTNISRHLRKIAYDEKGSLIGDTANKISDVIEGNLFKVLPQDLGKNLLDARAKYKALLAVKPLAERSAGDISPASLLNRISSQYSSIPAAGQLGEIAQAGKQYLTQKIPDSTTAQREMLLKMALPLMGGGAAVTGGVGVIPALALAGGATATAEAMSSPTIMAMVDLLKNKIPALSPQYVTPAMANYIRGINE